MSWELLYEPNFFCIFVLRVALGPRVKLAGCEKGFNPPLPPRTPTVVYSTDRSKAMVPVLVLLCCFVLYFYEAIYFKSCLVLFPSVMTNRNLAWN